MTTDPTTPDQADQTPAAPQPVSDSLEATPTAAAPSAPEEPVATDTNGDLPGDATPEATGNMAPDQDQTPAEAPAAPEARTFDYGVTQTAHAAVSGSLVEPDPAQAVHTPQAEAETPSEAPAPDVPAPGYTPESPETPMPAETPSTPPVEPVTMPSAPAVPEVPVAPVTPVEAPAPAPAPSVPPVTAEQSAPPSAAPTTQRANDMDLFDSYMAGDFQVEGDQPEGGFKRLSKGERIEATVIQVDEDKVFVDLGTKAEGIVPLGELSEQNLNTAIGLFNPGDKINVVVLRPEGAEGNPIVSKKRADFEEIWDRVENALRSGDTLKAQVVDRVKGGLVVDVGVRGFVPATHVGSGKLRNIEKFVGQPLDLKVIEIDRERKKVVLSNRQAEEENRAQAKDNIFQNVKPGDRLNGTVRRLTDYGAFVDLGGVDGLLHISEMSWARISHPKEMFKEGQDIEVMVLRLDPSNGKISLGHRQVLPDPWNLIRENYRNGQKLTVNVSRLVQSGAFIRLPEGAEAFMPVSEMSIRRIRRPQDVVEEGQEVEAQIIDLRPEERRMVLSMRAIGGGAELRPGATEAPSGFENDLRRGPGAGKGRDRRDSGGGEDMGGSHRRGFATGGATIGERLGALRGLLGGGSEEPEPSDEEK